MDKYEETKDILNAMADVKMKMNQHKGDIEKLDANFLIKLLKSEVVELEEACSKVDLIHVIEEAADAQNYLVALVHKQISIYRSRK